MAAFDAAPFPGRREGSARRSRMRHQAGRLQRISSGRHHRVLPARSRSRRNCDCSCERCVSRERFRQRLDTANALHYLMKHRLLRVNELLKRELSTLDRARDDLRRRARHRNQVDVTPDLKSAHVYVSVLGEGRQTTAMTQAGRESRRSCRPSCREHVVLKYTPHLVFHLDDSIERGARVFEILQEIETPPSETNERTTRNRPSERRTFAEIATSLRAHQRFAVLSHVRPDGDALGSQIATGASRSRNWAKT